MIPSVVVTRPQGPYTRYEQTVQLIQNMGLPVVFFPVLQCSRVPLSPESKRKLAGVVDGSTNWIVFLSPTAVAYFHEILKEITADRLLHPCVSIAAQGSGTADAVRTLFLREATLTPSVFVAEQFAETLAAQVSQGSRLIVPQAADGRDIVAPLLRAHHFSVDDLCIYKTEQISPPTESLSQLLNLGPSSVVFLFMSPSAVLATKKALEGVPDFLSRARIVSIGPITSRAIKANGLNVWREAAEHSEEGVLKALKDGCKQGSENDTA